jgi:YYY domain-containing protein
VTQPIGFDYFWGGSRTIDGAITEMPYFTQVWADLHAHAIALPFAILALGLIVSLVTLGLNGDETRQSLWQYVPGLGLLALTLGALFCTNAWDVPTYLLVTGAGLFHALRGRYERANGQAGEGAKGRESALTIVADGEELPPPPGVSALERGRVFARSILIPLVLAGVGTAATGAAAYIFYLPFFRNFKALVGGIGRTRITTPLGQYLDHFGLFMAIILLVIVAGCLGQISRPGRRSLLAGAALLAVIAAALGGRATQFTAIVADRTKFFANRMQVDPAPHFGQTAALLAPLLVMLLVLWFLNWGKTRVQLPLTLLIAGIGVTLGPEIIFVADDLMGDSFERMNTIFKFYMQGWTLFAIGGVGALAWVWQTAPRWSLAPFHRVRDREVRRGNAAGLRVFLAIVPLILFLASFAYPVITTIPRINEQFKRPAGLGPTLNGYRWMEYGTIPTEKCQDIPFADDYLAIKWMNQTIDGTPVIAEAAIGPYRGNGSRFSIATGLPTIIGWDRHEYQQRPPDGITQRSSDVRALYNGTDQAQKLDVLRKYHVSYVVVGGVERHWYFSPPQGSPACSTRDAYASEQGLAVLEGMAGQYLKPVFRSGETVVYQVLPSVSSSGIAAGQP